MKTSLFHYTSFLFCLLALPSIHYADEIKQASLVETATITRGTLSNTQTFIGSIHFSQSSLIASKTEGLVLKVNFDTTSQLNKGDVLVELDHEILDSRIRAIQASLKELKLLDEKSSKDLHRYQKLLKQKNVSQQKYDEIYYEKSRLDQKLISLQAELEALILEQQQNIIKAPFNGIITERHVELGEWVETGGKIATLVNPEKVTALFDIPAYYALNVTAEKKIKVQIGEETLDGIVEGVIIQGDTQSRTFPLKVKIPSSQSHLFEGMEARINLTRSNSGKSLLVPRDAIIKRFGNNVIFVVDNNIAKMYPVKILLFNGSLAAINDSTSLENQLEQADKPEKLTAGMHVITKGNERIFPGQSVKIK